MKISNKLRFGALLLTLFGVVFLLGRKVGARDGTPSFRTREEERVIDIYQSINDAVVFITTISMSVDPFDLFLEYQPRQGTGSGVIVDASRGIILTNLHVVGDAERIEITLADGRNLPGEFVGYDKSNDLAVLKLANPSGLTAVRFGDSSSLLVGQKVLAIGNPFGLHRSLTSGIISSLGRTVRNPNGPLLKGLIQTDASINPGNSGGPLLDLDGRLIGINTAILSQSGDSAGIGFAVPINNIKRALGEILKHGKVKEPEVGWVLIDTRVGPMVLRVLDGGPAEKAGIVGAERRVGGAFLRGFVRDFNKADLVVAVNGKGVRNADEVYSLVQEVAPNEELEITVKQGGPLGKARTIRLAPIFK
jgi:S1-C subfamily serine protease